MLSQSSLEYLIDFAGERGKVGATVMVEFLMAKRGFVISAS